MPDSESATFYDFACLKVVLETLRYHPAVNRHISNPSVIGHLFRIAMLPLCYLPLAPRASLRLGSIPHSEDSLMRQSHALLQHISPAESDPYAPRRSSPGSRTEQSLLCRVQCCSLQ